MNFFSLKSPIRFFAEPKLVLSITLSGYHVASFINPAPSQNPINLISGLFLNANINEVIASINEIVLLSAYKSVSSSYG